MTLEIGDRVSKTYKVGRGKTLTSYGTIAYVKPDRVGVAWDERTPHVFPAQRSEIEKVKDTGGSR